MLNRILGKFGFVLHKKTFLSQCYVRCSDFSPLEQLFYKFLHKDFFFIQIGANDGVSFDPIYDLVTENNVKGVVLEPIPFIYQKLKKNYEAYSNIIPINMAIHKAEKKMDIYYANPDKNTLPDWTKGIGSFNNEHYKLNDLSSEDILKTEVTCMSLEELLNKYKIHSVDLLQIDTEGYDYEIIKMIDFSKLKPPIISFEHGVLDGLMSNKKLNECQEILFKNDYNIITLKRDCIAYLR